MPIEPGTLIELAPATTERLGHEISSYIDDLEHDHREYLHAITAWWDWYDAIPAATKRNDPWPGASNIVIPLIKTVSDAVTARVWGGMHTDTRTWLSKSENEDVEASGLPTSIEEFINSESRNSWDVLTPTHDWSEENAVIGQSVLGLSWGRRTQFR